MNSTLTSGERLDRASFTLVSTMTQREPGAGWIRFDVFRDRRVATENLDDLPLRLHTSLILLAIR